MQDVLPELKARYAELLEKGNEISQELAPLKTEISRRYALLSTYRQEMRVLRELIQWYEPEWDMRDIPYDE